MKLFLKLWLILSLLVCGVAAILVRRQAAALDSLRSETAQRSTKEAGNEKAAVERLEQAEAARAVAEAKASKTEESFAKQKQLSDVPEKARAGDSQSFGRWINSCPELLPFKQRTYRRLVQMQYGALFAKLTLAPEQLEKLKQILVERVAAQEDAQDVIESGGGSVYENDANQFMKTLSAANETKVRELLGEAGYRTYKEFSVTEPIRALENSFRDFQSTLDYHGAPKLDGEQLRLLDRAHREVNPKYTMGSYSKDVNSAEADRRVRELVSGKLGVQQLQELAAFQERLRRERAVLREYLSKNGALPSGYLKERG